MIHKQENGGEAAWVAEEDGGGAAARMNVEEVLTKPVHSPSGVHKDLHGERAARVGVDNGCGTFFSLWVDGRF